ncbi:MAG: hypothetical protein V3S68_06980, partial [Dehalococcoidia bacterium]
MAHSPGPWDVGSIVDDAGDKTPVILAANGPVIAKLTGWTAPGERDVGITEANAKLIDAAPDMLKALEFIRMKFIALQK